MVDRAKLLPSSRRLVAPAPFAGRSFAFTHGNCKNNVICKEHSLKHVSRIIIEIYLLNRNTSNQTGNVTPFELWHGVKPNLQHLQSIGYVNEPKEKRRKLAPKSVKSYMFGTEGTEKHHASSTSELTLGKKFHRV
ncbi:unnamed protein product [Pieris macdunnoughi]|uniref:Uncharacterized protein n=1 Tax=Pieris macdunnoughi TaxID=345717 RepID=A0A821XSC9_9NEOP|nr:unnamed protein product [Pieris macdunnoughi]